MTKEIRCPGCVARNFVIMRQRQKIKALRNEVRRLQQIIANGQAQAAGIITQADDLLGEHQPRGKWAYATGARRSAKSILSRLK